MPGVSFMHLYLINIYCFILLLKCIQVYVSLIPLHLDHIIILQKDIPNSFSCSSYIEHGISSSAS